MQNTGESMISIVEGYTNGNREYRIYVNQVWVEQFKTYDEALQYKINYMKMTNLAKTNHIIDKNGKIHFTHEK